MEEISHRQRSRLLVAAAAVGLVAALTACGTEPSNDLIPVDPSPPAPDATDAAEAGDGTPEIVSPADDEVVSLPFDVTVDTDVELGAIEDGLHHLHIWFDEEDFGLHVSTTATISGQDQVVPEGETTMFVQVHTAEHGPVGEVVSISLTVEDDGTDPETGDDNGDDNGDSGYGY